jgi:hypothetical protein
MKNIKSDNVVNILNKDKIKLRSLNFSESYVNSVTDIALKWAKSGLLNDLKEPYICRNISTLCENQYNLNKSKNYVEKYYFKQWIRVSVPIIRRLFSNNFIGNDLVSVQPLSEVQQNVYSFGFDGRMNSHIVSSNRRRFATFWEKPDYNDRIFKFMGESFVLGLDAECAAIEYFVNNVRNEITREIIRDISANADKSVVYDYKDEDHLLSLIEGMGAYIAAKCFGKEATWVVTSSLIVKILDKYIEKKEDNFDYLDDGVNYIGKLNKKLFIFEDCLAPSGNILLGLKDLHNNYLSGYIYSPFVLDCPVISEDSEPSEVFMTYGKKLINSNFYGTIKMENLPDLTPLEDTEKELQESEE